MIGIEFWVFLVVVAGLLGCVGFLCWSVLKALSLCEDLARVAGEENRALLASLLAQKSGDPRLGAAVVDRLSRQRVQAAEDRAREHPVPEVSTEQVRDYHRTMMASFDPHQLMQPVAQE